MSWRARKVVIGDIQFDSKAESERYLYLLSRAQAREITQLECHPRYLLLEGFTDADGNRERPIHYTADFRYQEDGKTVVEDVKGGRQSRDYMLRRKLFKSRYREIVFREVKV